MSKSKSKSKKSKKTKKPARPGNPILAFRVDEKLLARYVKKNVDMAGAQASLRRHMETSTRRVG